VEDIPAARLFDTPEEKRARRDDFSNSTTMDLTLDAGRRWPPLLNWRAETHHTPSFGGTYLWLPAARRAVTIWFTPRIELLPVFRTRFFFFFFPLAQVREDEPPSIRKVTSLFFCC